jgi:hypothetical protein
MSDIEMTWTLTNITSTPFENRHIRRIIDRVIRKLHITLQGEVSMVDPFARESFTRGLEYCITNDLNEDFDTDYNLEFKDFAAMVKTKGIKFDLVVFDPPYSLRQLKDHYDGIGKDLKLWQTQNMWGEGKDSLAECVVPGGYVISLGWTSSGFGKKRGFEKRAVHVFEQAAREDRYSLLVTVEQKVQTNLLDYA